MQHKALFIFIFWVDLGLENCPRNLGGPFPCFGGERERERGGEADVVFGWVQVMTGIFTTEKKLFFCWGWLVWVVSQNTQITEEAKEVGDS